MKKETALKIANDFLRDKNPDNWDGSSCIPVSINTEPWLSDEKFLKKFNIQLSIKNNNGWRCCVEALDDGICVEEITTEIINEPTVIADTISLTEEQLIRKIMKGNIRIAKPQM